MDTLGVGKQLLPGESLISLISQDKRFTAIHLANTTFVNRSVPSSDNKKVVIAVVYHSFDKGELLLVGRREQLHPCGYAARFYDSMTV